MGLGAGRGDGGRRGIGAGESDHLVTGADELGDDGGTDEAGCASDEDPHESTSRDRLHVSR
jgi:hypothetical protein